MTVPPLTQVGLPFPLEQSGIIIVCAFTEYSTVAKNARVKSID